MTFSGTLLESLSQLGLPQIVHLLSAGLAFQIGRESAAGQRSVFWLLCGLMFIALGTAGFHYGTPQWPTDFRATGMDSHLFRPIPGIVELRSIDHVINLFFGGYFAGASFLNALEARLFTVRLRPGRASRAAAARSRSEQNLGPRP